MIDILKLILARFGLEKYILPEGTPHEANDICIMWHLSRWNVTWDSLLPEYIGTPSEGLWLRGVDPMKGELNDMPKA